MSNAKDEVNNILRNLPDDCTLEDVQHQLYVVEKIRRSTERADTEGTQTQQEVEDAFKRWNA